MVACTLVLVRAHPALIHTPQPLFLLLYVHPTTLAADGAAVASPAATVASPAAAVAVSPMHAAQNDRGG